MKGNSYLFPRFTNGPDGVVNGSSHKAQPDPNPSRKAKPDPAR